MMMFWHPIKHPDDAAEFYSAAAEAAPQKWLRAEIFVRRADNPAMLNGCGILVVNPPWTLAARLERLGPFLAERLAKGPGASFRIITG